MSASLHPVFAPAVGLKPRFVTVEPRTDDDVADVVHKISRRVIRMLRHLGYLEVGMDVPVATGYDPLLDNSGKYWP